MFKDFCTLPEIMVLKSQTTGLNILFPSLLQVEGFKMNLIYYDLYQSTRLEKFVTGMLLRIYQNYLLFNSSL
jgi:hypothetical protein